MRPRTDDGLDEGGTGRSDLLAPADKALRGPLQPALMMGRHMLLEGGVPSGQVASNVAGDPGVLVEAFDGALGVAHIELLSEQPVGDAVVMPLKLHVVVDVHGSFFPFNELVGKNWQRFEGGPVDLLEGRAPGAR